MNIANVVILVSLQALSGNATVQACVGTCVSHHRASFDTDRNVESHAAGCEAPFEFTHGHLAQHLNRERWAAEQMAMAALYKLSEARRAIGRDGRLQTNKGVRRVHAFRATPATLRSRQLRVAPVCPDWSDVGGHTPLERRVIARGDTSSAES